MADPDPDLVRAVRRRLVDGDSPSTVARWLLESLEVEARWVATVGYFSAALDAPLKSVIQATGDWAGVGLDRTGSDRDFDDAMRRLVAEQVDPPKEPGA